MRLSVLTTREASIFACLCDTIVAPEPVLPPVRETDAVRAFDAWLARSPRLNRAGLRALIYATELAPRALGFDARLRRLDRAGRAQALRAAEKRRGALVGQLVKLVEGLVLLCYYGDDRVMLRLGYDAEANLHRARELRARELRP